MRKSVKISIIGFIFIIILVFISYNILSNLSDSISQVEKQISSLEEELNIVEQKISFVNYSIKKVDECLSGEIKTGQHMMF